MRSSLPRVPDLLPEYFHLLQRASRKVQCLIGVSLCRRASSRKRLGTASGFAKPTINYATMQPHLGAMCQAWWPAPRIEATAAHSLPGCNLINMNSERTTIGRRVIAVNCWRSPASDAIRVRFGVAHSRDAYSKHPSNRDHPRARPARYSAD